MHSPVFRGHEDFFLRMYEEGQPVYRSPPPPSPYFFFFLGSLCHQEFIIFPISGCSYIFNGFVGTYIFLMALWVLYFSMALWVLKILVALWYLLGVKNDTSFALDS